MVPVHDEEALLGACLDAVARAARAVVQRARVRVVVVLDACSDGSERIARAHGVGWVRTRDRNVGRARAAGCGSLLHSASPPVWLASTDADSRTPADWLAVHLDAFDAGWDGLAGTVEIDDWGEHPPQTSALHHDAYDGVGDAHEHVHGTNLGVRASSYRAVGGFAPLATGEDVALVGRLTGAGHLIRRTRSIPVLTSARVEARAPHGFAADLVRAGRLVAPTQLVS